MSDTRRYERILYTYSREELHELAMTVCREEQRLADLEERKSAASAAFNAEIKDVTATIRDLTTKVTNGCEPREIEVMLLMDTPRPGVKSILRVDDNSTLREEPMTAAEQQRSFGFTEPK